MYSQLTLSSQSQLSFQSHPSPQQNGSSQTIDSAMQEEIQETVYSPELRVFIRRMNRDLKAQERVNTADSISPEMYTIPSINNPIHNENTDRNGLSFSSTLPAVTTTANTDASSTMPVSLHTNTRKSSQPTNELTPQTKTPCTHF